MYGSMRKKFLDDLLYDEVVGKIPTFLLFSSTSPNFRTSSLMTKFSVSEITLIVDPQI